MSSFYNRTQVSSGWGSWDVVWPASSTDNAIARFDSTTGKLIQNSSATISDAGLLSTDSATITTRINVPELKANSSAWVDIHNSSGTQIAIFGAGGWTGASINGTTNIWSGSADYHQLAWGTGTITDTATGSSTDINISLVPKGAWRVIASGNLETSGVIELWHASDTTISRVSAGKTAVEGVNQGTEGILQNSQSAAYTTVLTDAGKHIYHPSADTTARTWTIDSNANVAYPIGTAITFVNDTSAGTLTIAITSDTLVLAGAGTTGSRTLAANWVATAIKVTSTRWIISGTSNLS